jgi:predicted metal-dependent hydrolase
LSAAKPDSPRQLTLFGGSAPEPEAAAGAGADAVRVRRNPRARRLILRVHPHGGVEVVAPRRVPAREINAFVASHRDWIERTRESFARRFPPAVFALPDTMRLRAVDQVWRVDYRRGSGRLRTAERPGSSPGDWVLRVTGPVDDEARVVAALRRWLRDRARAHFDGLVPALARQMNAEVTRLQVRTQRTRWGSFSSSGTLSLNMCALFVRPALVRYLCVHELAHFHHMDHSPRFWATVARFEPDYRELDRELGRLRDVMPGWLGLD